MSQLETGLSLSSTEETESTETKANGADEPQEREYIDLSNLDLSSEEGQEGFDPDADPFQMPAPMDDGIYVGRVLFASREAEKRWQKIHDKNNQSKWWLETQLMCVVEDEDSKFHGRYAFDRRFVNTKLDRNRTTRIAGVLRGLSIQPPAGHAAQAKALTDAIDAGQNLLKFRITWEARHWDKDAKKETRLTGQKKFPQRDDGSYKPFILVNGEKTEAQARVMEYMPLTATTEE